MREGVCINPMYPEACTFFVFFSFFFSVFLQDLVLLLVVLTACTGLSQSSEDITQVLPDFFCNLTLELRPLQVHTELYLNFCHIDISSPTSGCTLQELNSETWSNIYNIVFAFHSRNEVNGYKMLCSNVPCHCCTTCLSVSAWDICWWVSRAYRRGADIIAIRFGCLMVIGIAFEQ